MSVDLVAEYVAQLLADYLVTVQERRSLVDQMTPEQLEEGGVRYIMYYRLLQSLAEEQLDDQLTEASQPSDEMGT